MTPTGPLEVVGMWYGGFWNLLSFAMQMTVILLFGYVLASSPPVERGIDRTARIPRCATQAIVMIKAPAVIFRALSWGLGLIVGGISARKISKNCLERGIKVHYPLVVLVGLGYTAVMMLFTTVIFGAGVTILPLIL